MKKIIAITIIAFLTASTVFISCKKENNNPITEIIKTTKQTREINHFDSIGMIHNDLLKNCNIRFPDMGYKDFNGVVVYFDSLGKNYYNLPTNLNKTLELCNIFKDASGNLYNNQEVLVSEVKKKYQLMGIDSVVFAKRLDRIYNLVEYLNTLNTVEDAIDYTSTYEAMVEAENIPQSEKEAAFYSIYLLRYSLIYWKDVLPADDVKKLRGWRCNLCVGFADAISGICLGAIAGPWAGLFGGAALSAYAMWCQCPSCKNYHKVSCFNFISPNHIKNNFKNEKNNNTLSTLL